MPRNQLKWLRALNLNTGDCQVVKDKVPFYYPKDLVMATLAQYAPCRHALGVLQGRFEPLYVPYAPTATIDRKLVPKLLRACVHAGVDPLSTVTAIYPNYIWSVSPKRIPSDKRGACIYARVVPGGSGLIIMAVDRPPAK